MLDTTKGKMYKFLGGNTSGHSFLEVGDVVRMTGEFFGQDRAVIIKGKHAGKDIGVLLFEKVWGEVN